MGTGKNILIVEDEQELLDIISMVLKSKGYNVYTATNGRMAMDLINAGNVEIDLILSDIIMPQMNGIELLDEIKSKLPYKPIVALTTGHTNTNIEDIYAKGAVNLLRKPFHLDALIKMIKNIFDNHLEVPVETEESIELLFQNIDSKDIKLGQKGIFLKNYINPNLLNTIVNIDIKFKEGVLKEIKGIGEVVWIRSSEIDSLNKGTGILFLSMSAETENLIKAYVKENKIVATIPKN